MSHAWKAGVAIVLAAIVWNTVHTTEVPVAPEVPVADTGSSRVHDDAGAPSDSPPRARPRIHSPRERDTGGVQPEPTEGWVDAAVQGDGSSL